MWGGSKPAFIPNPGRRTQPWLESSCLGLGTIADRACCIETLHKRSDPRINCDSPVERTHAIQSSREADWQRILRNYSGHRRRSAEWHGSVDISGRFNDRAKLQPSPMTFWDRPSNLEVSGRAVLDPSTTPPPNTAAKKDACVPFPAANERLNSFSKFKTFSCCRRILGTPLSTPHIGLSITMSVFETMATLAEHRSEPAYP